ncbi:hypothetical protein EK21DRAFT_90098 [Setomelanomma holmii]|uniref:Uncharacterized protein n=1 Tax=Setomelanomma holmii TaxID=210430 RepID=A0A9P4H6G4_9PLEO|nr:hypothetical protein EK21DRAFT_90098 [Setomelanomma holmii]
MGTHPTLQRFLPATTADGGQRAAAVVWRAHGNSQHLVAGLDIGYWDCFCVPPRGILERSCPGPPVSGATIQFELYRVQRATAAGGAWRVVSSLTLGGASSVRSHENPHSGPPHFTRSESRLQETGHPPEVDPSAPVWGAQHARMAVPSLHSLVKGASQKSNLYEHTTPANALLRKQLSSIWIAAELTVETIWNLGRMSSRRGHVGGFSVAYYVAAAKYSARWLVCATLYGHAVEALSGHQDLGRLQASPILCRSLDVTSHGPARSGGLPSSRRLLLHELGLHATAGFDGAICLKYYLGAHHYSQIAGQWLRFEHILHAFEGLLIRQASAAVICAARGYTCPSSAKKCAVQGTLKSQHISSVYPKLRLLPEAPLCTGLAFLQFPTTSTISGSFTRLHCLVQATNPPSRCRARGPRRPERLVYLNSATSRDGVECTSKSVKVGRIGKVNPSGYSFQIRMDELDQTSEFSNAYARRGRSTELPWIQIAPVVPDLADDADGYFNIFI